MNVKNVIFRAIDGLNNTLPKKDHLEKSHSTPIYGRNSKLDSLGLVNLIVAIEQQIEDEFERSITIADERAMSQKHSPFKTVETLINYITILLAEQTND